MLNVTIKEVDKQYKMFVNDLHFATIYIVSPPKGKGKHKWSFRLEHLPVDTITVYKSPADAVIVLEKYINLLNRAQK